MKRVYWDIGVSLVVLGILIFDILLVIWNTDHTFTFVLLTSLWALGMVTGDATSRREKYAVFIWLVGIGVGLVFLFFANWTDEEGRLPPTEQIFLGWTLLVVLPWLGGFIIGHQRA